MKVERPQILPAGRYNTAQAAEILGVDRHTIMRWHKAGELRASATNGRRRYFKGTDLMKAYYSH
ncbi:MAG: helix-turn-helix domain-containing protein [Bacteroidales bacterium]|nr:helix-turn-helix domain-containing protein [Bacteroidales bacterium]